MALDTRALADDRRGGLGEGDGQRITPLDLVRPIGTGTMAEAVGTRAHGQAPAAKLPANENVEVGAGGAATNLEKR